MSKKRNPRDGAQRKKAFDDRKREQGLKEFRSWVTESEARRLKDFLENIRAA